MNQPPLANDPPSPAQPCKQLQMLWSPGHTIGPRTLQLDQGYELRTFRDGDSEGLLRVMVLAGFDMWNADYLSHWRDRIDGNGWFVIVHRLTGAVVATAMASHCPGPQHPSGGELGWVAADPAHAGRGLGAAVCAAVVAHFIGLGYRRIYLRTDDARLPAIKTYLKLGFVPWLYAPDMRARWEGVCAALPWTFSPNRWSDS